MHKFDYSFLKNISIPSNTASMISYVERSKDMTDNFKEKYPRVFDNLVKIAKVQSVYSSNAIEGILTTDKRVKDLVNGNTEPRNHNEQEIAGYRDALNIIHSNPNMSLDESNICLLHKTLLSRTNLDFGGQYKKTDNLIVQIDSNGNRSIRFRPVSAIDTPKAMEQLWLAYVDARQDYSINPLLLIPCFILDFLSIHPFSDGNGRVSRLLSILLLYQSGFDGCKYVSFENKINNNKDLYYKSLDESSINWHSNENDYWPFISFFVFSLSECYREIQKRYDLIKSKKLSKSERIDSFINESLGKFSKEDIHDFWPDISYCTIENELHKLLREGVIQKIGNTNGAEYIKKN